MFVAPEDRRFGEPPRRPKKDFIPSSKGYPARRDPQAENPKGVISSNLSPVEERHWRNRYGAAKRYVM